MPVINKTDGTTQDIGMISYNHESGYRAILVRKIGDLPENVCHVKGQYKDLEDDSQLITLDLAEKDILFFRALNNLLKKIQEISLMCPTEVVLV